MIYKILSSLKTVVGVRFSISKGIFLGIEGYDDLAEARYSGTFTRRGANHRYCLISPMWLTDVYSLPNLLAPALGLQLEKYANGMGAPKLTGRALAEEQVAARRAGAAAGAPAGQEAAAPRVVDVEWMDGGVRRVQKWTVVEPEAVTVDERSAAGHEEYGMKLKRVLPNPEPTTLRTGYDFLFQWSVPPPFLTELEGFMNERLAGNTAYTRKTSKGELVRFLSYNIALSLCPNTPVANCWKEKPEEGDIFPPLNMGRHGLSKNRWGVLHVLCATFWKVDESDLDSEDIWRYTRWPLAKFNTHRELCMDPGDALVSDEGMCAYLGKVAKLPLVSPTDLPIQSFVPRKPKDTGGEVKMLCDGTTGVTLRMEHDVGKELNPRQDFVSDWVESAQAFTIAQNIRLLRHYFKTHRTYGADSWFMGVSEVEALLQEVHIVCLVIEVSYFVLSYDLSRVSFAFTFPVPAPPTPPQDYQIYGFGAVKTHTSRFPMKELEALCGPESGDWAVMETTVLGGHKVYAIAHRRGGAVRLE